VREGRSELAIVRVSLHILVFIALNGHLGRVLGLKKASMILHSTQSHNKHAKRQQVNNERHGFRFCRRCQTTADLFVERYAKPLPIFGR